VAELTLTESQNGAHLTLRVGDTIIVRLAESSAAGYRWSLASAESDRIEVLTAHQPARAGIGSAGTSIWRVTAKAAGRVAVELKKSRAWQPADSHGGRFALDLTIVE